MAQFKLTQINRIGGITEAQKAMAKKMLRGINLAKGVDYIEAADQATVLAMIDAKINAPKKTKKALSERNIENKQDFNVMVVTAAKKAVKNGIAKQAVIDAINALSADIEKQKTAEAIKKLMEAKGFSKEQIIEALG